MNNIDIPPFFVGQEVVAIETHYQGAIKKGDEFIVMAIRKGCCDVVAYEIDIGIKSGGTSYCWNCKKMEYTIIWWLASKYFRPKQSFGEFISMKEFAEKQLETIGAH